MGLLIHDGYTLEDTLPKRGRYPAVVFRYRPALAEAVYEYRRASRDGGKEEARATVKLLKDHLVSWDVTDDKDVTVPITPEALAKVPERVQQWLVNYVTGYGPDQQEADVKN